MQLALSPVLESTPLQISIQLLLCLTLNPAKYQLSCQYLLQSLPVNPVRPLSSVWQLGNDLQAASCSCSEAQLVCFPCLKDRSPVWLLQCLMQGGPQVNLWNSFSVRLSPLFPGNSCYFSLSGHWFPPLNSFN